MPKPIKPRFVSKELRILRILNVRMELTADEKSNYWKYDFEMLIKRLACAGCHSFSVVIGERNLVCDVCGCVEKIDDAILRCVSDLKLLFPEEKITCKRVYEWCGGNLSLKTIRRVLKRNFTAKWKNKYCYYE